MLWADSSERSARLTPAQIVAGVRVIESFWDLDRISGRSDNPVEVPRDPVDPRIWVDNISISRLRYFTALDIIVHHTVLVKPVNK